jgi:hypothetical protein
MIHDASFTIVIASTVNTTGQEHKFQVKLYCIPSKYLSCVSAYWSGLGLDSPPSFVSPVCWMVCVPGLVHID